LRNEHSDVRNRYPGNPVDQSAEFATDLYLGAVTAGLIGGGQPLMHLFHGVRPQFLNEKLAKKSLVYCGLAATQKRNRGPETRWPGKIPLTRFLIWAPERGVSSQEKGAR